MKAIPLLKTVVSIVIDLRRRTWARIASQILSNALKLS